MRLDHLLSKENRCKQLDEARSAEYNTTKSRNTARRKRQGCEADLGGAIATPYPKVSKFKVTWSFCESKRDLWNCEAMNTNFSLFNLEGIPLLNRKNQIWGFSSAGRAPALQAGGQRFDPANLHQISVNGAQLDAEKAK